MIQNGVAAALFAGYAIGIALAFIRVVLRYPPIRLSKSGIISNKRSELR